MAEFITFARRFILSLDSTDGGDLIRATGYPKKLQFGAFEIPTPPPTPFSSSVPATTSTCNNKIETRIIAVILWGQTLNRQDKDLHVTEALKQELLKLIDMGERGRIEVEGIAWRIIVVEGVESSDGAGDLDDSLI